MVSRMIKSIARESENPFLCHSYGNRNPTRFPPSREWRKKNGNNETSNFAFNNVYQNLLMRFSDSLHCILRKWLFFVKILFMENELQKNTGFDKGRVKLVIVFFMVMLFMLASFLLTKT